MELISFSKIQEVLEEYASRAKELYKYQVSLGGHNASRDLINSVETMVTVDGGGTWRVSLQLNEYWKYLEGGSKGTESSPSGAVYPAHFPPPSAILDWIRVKPVLPQPLADGKIPSLKSLSYLISRSIQRHGIEPYPALATTIDELNEQYKDKFIIALSSDVGQYINKVLVSLGNGAMSQRL